MSTTEGEKMVIRHPTIPSLLWSDDMSVMHKMRESTRYERSLFYSYLKGKPENQVLDGGREGDGIFGKRRRVGF